MASDIKKEAEAKGEQVEVHEHFGNFAWPYAEPAEVPACTTVSGWLACPHGNGPRTTFQPQTWLLYCPPARVEHNSGR